MALSMQFSADDEAFREEVRDFLNTHLSPALRDAAARQTTVFPEREVALQWQRVLQEAKGWAAPAWPKAFGGPGFSANQRYIFNQECARAGAPGLIPLGLRMLAPVFFRYGTPGQQAHYLPKILSGEHYLCQGYSEPGSGSDLSSLRTTATRDGDVYRVNGTKLWTTHGHFADHIFCLVRTDNSGKKQEGITFILIDMKSEGIKVNPIISIDNHHSLNEVEFNNVRVPAKNVVGEIGKGWTVAKALLAHERTGIAGVADVKRAVRVIKEVAAKEENGGQRLMDDPGFQQRLADIEVELMALEFTELRTLATQAAGGFPGPESSLLKIKGTELQQATQELLMEIAAYYQGVLPVDLDPEALGHEFATEARRNYMYGRAATIYGGSNEVQKNIIAKYVLGLE